MSTSPVHPGTVSPFLDAFRFEEEVDLANPTLRSSSPFRSAYQSEGESGEGQAEADEFVSFLTELHDEELNDALYEVANEASQLSEATFTSQIGPRREPDMHRLLLRQFEPSLRELEQFVQSVASNLGARDPRLLTESEIELAVDRYVPLTEMTPAFENLFGGLKKLVKKVAGKAVDLTKRGVKAAAAFGLGPILSKLAALIRPWLIKLLGMVLKHVPPQYRSIAESLAKRFPGVQITSGVNLPPAVVQPAPIQAGPVTPADPVVPAGPVTVPVPEPTQPGPVEPAPPPPKPEPGDADADPRGDGAELASPDPAVVQHELNLQVAELLFAEAPAEQDLAVARFLSEIPPEGESLDELELARQEFASRISSMKSGEDASPAVERFIPAIVPVAKVAIGLLGRKGVVERIAQIIAKLIERFVGRDQVLPLSRILADKGLRLVNLEATAEDEVEAAADALTETVEETVRRAGQLPSYVLGNQAALEGFVVDAFEQAAAAHLPVLSEEAYFKRPDLRVIHGPAGFWLRRPHRRGPKTHKRLTRVFDVVITPQIAKAVKTFGGIPLSAFLRDQLGQALGAALKARVHVFEAIPGTTLAAICRNEKDIPGLGGTHDAHRMLHPLTTSAAGLLLQQPDLGRDLPGALADRRAVKVGMRFYYLEIAGAHVRVHQHANGISHVRRSTQASLAFDFPENRIRVRLFLSEADSQEMAVKLRKRTGVGAVLPTLARLLESRLLAILTGEAHGHVRVIHPAVPPDLARGPVLNRLPRAAQEKLAQKLAGWIVERTGQFFDQQLDDFIKATEDERDGVTLMAVLEAAPVLAPLGAALTGKPAAFDDAALAVKPGVALTVAAGFHRE